MTGLNYRYTCMDDESMNDLCMCVYNDDQCKIWKKNKKKIEKKTIKNSKNLSNKQNRKWWWLLLFLLLLFKLKANMNKHELKLSVREFSVKYLKKILILFGCRFLLYSK